MQDSVYYGRTHVNGLLPFSRTVLLSGRRGIRERHFLCSVRYRGRGRRGRRSFYSREFASIRGSNSLARVKRALQRMGPMKTIGKVDSARKNGTLSAP